MNFELALIVADGAVRPTRTGVASDIQAKSLGFQEVDLPVAVANVLKSTDGITNVGELNEESTPRGLIASKNATAGWIGVGLIRDESKT